MPETYEIPALLTIILLLYTNVAVSSLLLMTFVVAMVTVFSANKAQSNTRPRGINLSEFPRSQFKSTSGQAAQKYKVD